MFQTRFLIYVCTALILITLKLFRLDKDATMVIALLLGSVYKWWNILISWLCIAYLYIFGEYLLPVTQTKMTAGWQLIKSKVF